MFDTCPKTRKAHNQPYADAGFAAAKAGQPLAAIGNLFNPIARSAWLLGWEGGGGDPNKGVVVTEVERLEQTRVEMVVRLSRIENRLAELRAAGNTGDAT